MGVLIGQERKRHEIKLLLRGAHRLEVAVIKAPFGHVAVTKPAQCARRRRRTKQPFLFSLPVCQKTRCDTKRKKRTKRQSRVENDAREGNNMKRGLARHLQFCSLWRRDGDDADNEMEHARRLDAPIGSSPTGHPALTRIFFKFF